MNGWFSWQVFWEIWPVPWILVDSLFSYPHLCSPAFWWNTPGEGCRLKGLHRLRQLSGSTGDRGDFELGAKPQRSRFHSPEPMKGDSQPTPNKIGDVGNEKSLFFSQKMLVVWYKILFFLLLYTGDVNTAFWTNSLYRFGCTCASITSPWRCVPTAELMDVDGTWVQIQRSIGTPFHAHSGK